MRFPSECKYSKKKWSPYRAAEPPSWNTGGERIHTSVRILPRNRTTNTLYIFIREKERETYLMYPLSHTITEVEKPPHLSPAGWRLRKAHAVASAEARRPENQKGLDGSSSHPSTGEDPPRSLRVGHWEPMPFPPLFCSIQMLNAQRRRCPPAQGRATCFTPSTDSKAYLAQKHPQTHPEITFNQIFGHFMIQSSGHI